MASHHHIHTTHDEEENDHHRRNSISTPLLSQKSPTSSRRLFLSLFIFSVVACCLAAAFAVFFSSSSSKLNRPIVILISCDGFRYGYQFKTNTPNIHRLIAGGTTADEGLIPVFPTLTYPNHYAIVTGLYPAFHGIINNYFVDPLSNETFTTSNRHPKWWLGEPLWQTVVKNGLKAATYFWPGSEVHKEPWTCPENLCHPYNSSVPFEERVDTTLKYFDLPSDEIPSFMTIYFSDPDSQGHKVGPDHPNITKAVANVDSMIGRLIQGLEQRNVLDDVHIILLGDHGMVGTCDKRFISLEDLSPWIEISSSWIDNTTPLLTIRPNGTDPAYVVSKMNEALKSGKVENGEYLKVYLKEDLPKRFHYSDSYRIPPVLGLVDEGYKVVKKRDGKPECAGSHGYDNAFFSMRTIFIGHGPRFAKGRKIPSFENVQIYNLITSILKIKGAATNGSHTFPSYALLPDA